MYYNKCILFLLYYSLITIQADIYDYKINELMGLIYYPHNSLHIDNRLTYWHQLIYSCIITQVILYN